MEQPRLLKRIVIIFIAYVVIAYGAIVIIDFLNLFGSQAIMHAIQDTLNPKRFEVPLFWYFISTQGSFTENMQWAYLLIATITLFVASRTASRQGEVLLSRGFKLWGAGLTLLFLEDTLNTRHWIRRGASALLNLADNRSSAAAISVEIFIYALMGILMLYALFRLRRLVFSHARITACVLIGYAAYGLAAAFSATRHAFGWYSRAGEALIETFNLRSIDTWRIASEIIEMRSSTLGYYLMDYLVEETLELLGAGMLAFASVMLLYLIKRPNNEQTPAPH